jgi:hypothetical protein
LSACYYKDDDYLPANIDANKVIIDLKAVSLTIPADGQSFTYIIAELPVNAIEAKSTVTFTTTRGTFENNTKTMNISAVLINENNQNKRIAKVKLISSTVIETADITATVAGVTKNLSVSFTNLALDTFLSISAPPNVLADGVSNANIIVEQPLNVPSDYTSVTFTTTAGTFENGNKTIVKSSALILVDGVYKRLVQTRLTASKNEESAIIEAAIKGTLKTQVVQFKRAHAESIHITVAALSIASGFANSLQITTNLLRSKGTPTQNSEATLKAVDTTNIERGILINYSTKSDANGQIINKFSMGNDPYKGKLKLIAASADSVGHPISDTTLIFVQ